MTITRTFIPDPPPSEHAQAPPTHAGSNMPADEGVWAAARRSYLAGCSTPVVAERHGLNERTVRRRAAAEDWAGLRSRSASTRRPSDGLFGAPPLFAGEPRSAEAELERRPELQDFVAAHSYEVGQLLLDPKPERLCRFAFRRSAEAAAGGGATEALAWMRLVQAIDRTHERLDRASRPFSAADYMRADYATQLYERFEGRTEPESDDTVAAVEEAPAESVEGVGEGR